MTISITVLLITILALSIVYNSLSNVQPVQTFVGVAFCGNTVDEAKLLIDRIKGFSNLFILQSGPISKDENATTQICDYAVNSGGLSIIVYFGDLDPRILAIKGLEWRATWASSARERYGEHFLGVYYYDERGGIYLDTDKNSNNWRLPANASYSSVASSFINGFISDPGTVNLKTEKIPIFCSDYALYWFDFLSGYDVVLTQIGWNHSIVQDIALIRGAARMQHKDWGAIITWKYNEPPYLDSGEAIYQQMLTSYRAGAKYIAVFNYPYSDGNPYGTMADEHFEALERLWNDIAHGDTAANGSVKADSVLVLPRDYGFGMRKPQDSIWGFWGPDAITPQVWNISQRLQAQYGYSLDIIYDDPKYPLHDEYNSVYFWNSTLTD